MSGRELMAFRIGAQEFCVDIMAVREIRGFTPATPLPQSPGYVRGVINLRGAVLPIIDLAAPNLHDAVRDQVYAQTDKRGADVILDMLGGDIFDAAIRALAWRGRLVVIGFAAGRIPTIKANYLLLKNIEVSGMQVSDYRKRTPDLMDKCFADIFAQLASGRLKPLPVKTYPLVEFASGLREIRDRTQRGRIVLTQDGA